MKGISGFMTLMARFGATRLPVMSVQFYVVCVCVYICILTKGCVPSYHIISYMEIIGRVMCSEYLYFQSNNNNNNI